MFISSTLNIPLYMQGCSFTDRVTVQQSHLSVWREMTVSTWTVLVCMDRTTSVKMDSVFVLTMEWIVSIITLKITLKSNNHSHTIIIMLTFTKAY